MIGSIWIGEYIPFLDFYGFLCFVSKHSKPLNVKKVYRKKSIKPLAVKARDEGS
jgi:hypothetical protein